MAKEGERVPCQVVFGQEAVLRLYIFGISCIQVKCPRYIELLKNTDNRVMLQVEETKEQSRVVGCTLAD